MSGISFFKELANHLYQEERPLREVIDESLAKCVAARERIRLERPHLAEGVVEGIPRYFRDQIMRKSPKSLDRDRLWLRELADTAMRDFNSQLVIIQSG